MNHFIKTKPDLTFLSFNNPFILKHWCFHHYCVSYKPIVEFLWSTMFLTSLLFNVIIMVFLFLLYFIYLRFCPMHCCNCKVFWNHPPWRFYTLNKVWLIICLTIIFSRQQFFKQWSSMIKLSVCVTCPTNTQHRVWNSGYNAYFLKLMYRVFMYSM